MNEANADEPAAGAPQPKISLVLSATSAGGAAAVAPDPLTDLAPDAEVTFTVASENPVAKPSLFDNANSEIDAVFVNEEKASSSKTWRAKVTFVMVPESVYAKVIGTDALSAAMRIATAIPTKGSPSPADPAPAEVEIGEYDSEFARWTGSVFRGLAYVASALAAWLVLWLLPMGSSACCETVDFRERVVAAGSALALLAGCLAVLAAVWMSTLEVRGRQRVRVQLTEGGTRGALGVSIDEIERLAKALSKVRGTVAAYVVGVILVVIGLAGLVGGGALEIGQPQPADPKPTSTVQTAPR